MREHALRGYAEHELLRSLLISSSYRAMTTNCVRSETDLLHSNPMRRP